MQRVLVVGASSGGGEVVSGIARSKDANVRVVGVLDRDRGKVGSFVHGVPVLGTHVDAGSVFVQHEVTECVLAIAEVDANTLDLYVRLANQHGVTLKIIPSAERIANSIPLYRQARAINMSELIGRKSKPLDLARVQAWIAGRQVLVTGAAGSIGSELTRQLARADASLLGVDINENELHMLSVELDGECASAPRFYVGDIVDEVFFRALIEEYRPQVVFHAAANKHVPLLESQPRRALVNNVLGTLRAATLTANMGGEHFVLISTDKAVAPANVMGASKRFAEKVVRQVARENSGLRCSIVRFGNVLGSAGSVYPIFKSTFEKEQKVRVTSRVATRYFMSIPEAASLVLGAATLPGKCSTYILEMGEPVSVGTLAERFLLANGIPLELVGRHIDEIGLRPGEKLHEELFYEDERSRLEEHLGGAVMSVSDDESDFYGVQEIHDDLVELARGSITSNELFKKYVPEYKV